jgi:hypothetical protein
MRSVDIIPVLSLHVWDAGRPGRTDQYPRIELMPNEPSPYFMRIEESGKAKIISLRHHQIRTIPSSCFIGQGTNYPD